MLIAALAIAGCATSGGGGVGGVVIDAPQKDFTASVNGTVLYDGRGIEGALIELINHEASTSTDKNGRFYLDFDTRTRLGVNRIRVLVRASKEGYRTRTRGVYVVIDQTASVIIELLPKVSN